MAQKTRASWINVKSEEESIIDKQRFNVDRKQA